MATTVLEFIETKKDTWTALQARAQADLAQATQAVADARGAYDERVEEYADLEDQLKQNQAARAAAPAPPDSEELTEQWRDLRIQLRRKQAALIAQETVIATAMEEKRLADNNIKIYNGLVQGAVKEFADAEARNAHHTKWKAAVAAGGLTTLAANATALLALAATDPAEGDDNGAGGNEGGEGDEGGGSGNAENEESSPAEEEGTGGEGGESGSGEEGTGEEDPSESENDDAVEDGDDPLAAGKTQMRKATTRIIGDIPAALLNRARARRAQVIAVDNGVAGLRLAVEDGLCDHWEATGGASGMVARRWKQFLRAEAAFKDFVISSQNRYHEALTLLEGIIASPSLTPAQKARLAEADLIAAGQAAIALEESRDEARAAVAAAVNALALATVQAQIADVSADPADDPAVQAAEADLAAKTDALNTAEDHYTQPLRTDLDMWEAAVPDHIWGNLVGYDLALSLLREIQDGDPAALAAAMDNSQAALVAALEAETGSLRLTHYLEGRIALLAGMETSAADTRVHRMRSAIRGDA